MFVPATEEQKAELREILLPWAHGSIDHLSVDQANEFIEEGGKLTPEQLAFFRAHNIVHLPSDRGNARRIIRDIDPTWTPQTEADCQGQQTANPEEGVRS